MKINIFFLKLLSIFYLTLCAFQANALEIALSFDDAPLPDGSVLTGAKRTKTLIQTLKEKKVQEAVFFCNSLQNFNKKDRARIRNYSEAGHIIANHTASHIDFYAFLVDAKKFITDIQEADSKLSIFPNYKRWFRYPYLRQSKYKFSTDNDQNVEIYLEKEKYKHGYITIETYDWYLNKLVKEDIENGIKLDNEKIKKAYISMLWDGIIFYDNLAKNVLDGRSPKHIILLHENDVNALFIGDLIDHIRSNGGTIIPITEAYSDPIADLSLDLIPYSQRRIRAIARSKNYKGNTISQYEDTKNIDKLYRAVVREL